MKYYFPELINLDFVAGSQKCYAYMLYFYSSSNLQIGRTERLDNTLNPRFSKAVTVDYFFEELQKLKFFIYDIDSPSGNLKSADFLGEMECTLGQVQSQSYTL